MKLPLMGDEVGISQRCLGFMSESNWHAIRMQEEEDFRVRPGEKKASIGVSFMLSLRCPVGSQVVMSSKQVNSWDRSQ